MRKLHKNFIKYSDPTVSHPSTKMNHHTMLGHHIKDRYPHLPYLQALHIGKSKSM